MTVAATSKPVFLALMVVVVNGGQLVPMQSGPADSRLFPLESLLKLTNFRRALGSIDRANENSMEQPGFGPPVGQPGVRPSVGPPNSHYSRGSAYGNGGTSQASGEVGNGDSEISRTSEETNYGNGGTPQTSEEVGDGRTPQTSEQTDHGNGEPRFDSSDEHYGTQRRSQPEALPPNPNEPQEHSWPPEPPNPNQGHSWSPNRDQPEEHSWSPGSSNSNERFGYGGENYGTQEGSEEQPLPQNPNQEHSGSPNSNQPKEHSWSPRSSNSNEGFGYGGENYGTQGGSEERPLPQNPNEPQATGPVPPNSAQPFPMAPDTALAPGMAPAPRSTAPAPGTSPTRSTEPTPEEMNILTDLIPELQKRNSQSGDNPAMDQDIIAGLQQLIGLESGNPQPTQTTQAMTPGMLTSSPIYPLAVAQQQQLLERLVRLNREDPLWMKLQRAKLEQLLAAVLRFVKYAADIQRDRAAVQEASALNDLRIVQMVVNG